MCKDIESIKNVTIFTDLSSGVDFTQNVIINNQPDECVVRSISYAGDETVDPKGTYLIWSDLINDYVGSFSIGNNVALDYLAINTNPQTRIFLKNKPLASNSTLRFAVHSVGVGNRVSAVVALSGELAVCLDFIKYTK